MSRPSLLRQQRALACSFSPLLKSCCCLWLISALGWLCALGSSSQLCLSQRSPHLLALLHFSQRFPHCLVHPHQRFPHHLGLYLSLLGALVHPAIHGSQAVACLRWGSGESAQPPAVSTGGSGECAQLLAAATLPLTQPPVAASHHQLNHPLNRLWLLIRCKVQLHLRQSLSRCLAQLCLCQRSAHLHVHSLHIHIHAPTQTNTGNLPGHLKLSAPVFSLVGVLEGTFCTTAAAHAAQPPDLLDLCAASHVITFWTCFACAAAASYAVGLWT